MNTIKLLAGSLNKRACGILSTGHGSGRLPRPHGENVDRRLMKRNAHKTIFPWGQTREGEMPLVAGKRAGRHWGGFGVWLPAVWVKRWRKPLNGGGRVGWDRLIYLNPGGLYFHATWRSIWWPLTPQLPNRTAGFGGIWARMRGFLRYPSSSQNFNDTNIKYCLIFAFDLFQIYSLIYVYHKIIILSFCS